MQEWNQNDTYNLYLSDTRGVYFTLAMENVKTTRGIGGNQMLDLYEVGTQSEEQFWLPLQVFCFLLQFIGYFSSRNSMNIDVLGNPVELIKTPLNSIDVIKNTICSSHSLGYKSSSST